jgi:hypothetical protein
MSLPAGYVRSGGSVFDDTGRRVFLQMAGGAPLDSSYVKSGGRIFDADGREVIVIDNMPAPVAGTADGAVIYGAGAPSNAFGKDGDTYIDTTNRRIYGPRAGGVWPGTFVAIDNAAQLPGTITGAADQQILVARPNGAVPVSSSAGGAINVDTTGTTGPGVVLYSNRGADALSRLLSVRVDHAANPFSAIYSQYKGAGHGVVIDHQGNGAASVGLNLTSTNTADTTLGIRGRENGRGTIKATHENWSGSATGDQNASVLSLRLNAPDAAGSGGANLTAAQGIFLDTEDGPTTGKLINIRQQGRERFVVGPDGDLLTGGHNLNEFHMARRASDVFSMPDTEAAGVFNLTANSAYGALAIALKDGTATGMRVCTGSTAPAGLTDFRVVAWNSAGAVVAQSANASASVTTTNQLVDVDFLTPLAYTEKTAYFIGIVFQATTLNMRGAASVAALCNARGSRTLGLARATAYATAGTIPTLASGSTGSILWAELR